MNNYLYKNRKFLLILAILFTVTLLSGTTYAIFTTTAHQESENKIVTLDCLDLQFSNQQNIITLNDTYPMTDERGKQNTPYTFTLTNTCHAYIEYLIELMPDKTNTLLDNYVKTSFSAVGGNKDAILLTNRSIGEEYNNSKTYILQKDGLNINESKNYELTLWVDGTAAQSEVGKSFKGRIVLYEKPANKNSSQN